MFVAFRANPAENIAEICVFGRIVCRCAHKRNGKTFYALAIAERARRDHRNVVGHDDFLRNVTRYARNHYKAERIVFDIIVVYDVSQIFKFGFLLPHRIQRDISAKARIDRFDYIEAVRPAHEIIIDLFGKRLQFDFTVAQFVIIGVRLVFPAEQFVYIIDTVSCFGYEFAVQNQIARRT